MPRRKQHPVKEPLQVCSVKLTPAAATFLLRVGQDTSDNLGWTVTSSAVVRALIQYAQQQPPDWATTTLQPLIETEIAAGRVWGKPAN
jgi:hypothetical protein